MQSLDWQTIEQACYDRAEEVIKEFAKEHPDILCSFFACFADPFSGTFAFCFDTPENAAYEAMKQELMLLRRKQTTQERPGSTDAWRYARSTVNLSLQSYPHTSDFFQYSSYAKLKFNWLEFADSPEYPQREEGQDDYLEGQTRWLICRVMDRLVAGRIFEHLSMTSPFRLGYEFHEEGLTVLRLLNWPTIGGNTIYSVLDSSMAQGRPNEEWHQIGTEEYAHRGMPKDALARSDFPLVVVSAFPSSLSEQPWSKDIDVTLNVGDTSAIIQGMWPQVYVDLDGLGRIRVHPTLLEIHLKAAVRPDTYTLTLYDRDQQEFGTVSPGLSLEQSASLFSEQICFLKIGGTSNRSHLSKKGVIIQVRLHIFRALLSLPSRNLWWLENEEGRRIWQENELEYTDPLLLLNDLGTHGERFIAESGVIGYQERRKKFATLLFALGKVAQAIEAYPQATQFYGKSRQKFQSLGNIEATENVLLILRDLFLRQGKEESAKRMSSELLKLKASQ